MTESTQCYETIIGRRVTNPYSNILPAFEINGKVAYMNPKTNSYTMAGYPTEFILHIDIMASRTLPEDYRYIKIMDQAVFNYLES